MTTLVSRIFLNLHTVVTSDHDPVTPSVDWIGDTVQSNTSFTPRRWPTHTIRGTPMNRVGAPEQDDLDVIGYDRDYVVLSRGGHYLP